VTTRHYYVYLLASTWNGRLYTGVTNNLVRRTAEHKEGVGDGFTSRYFIHRLVWYEVHTSIDAAIAREKQIKRWKREWKINLFRETNPDWIDLYPELVRGIWT
jgi:putative endonuclease